MNRTIKRNIVIAVAALGVFGLGAATGVAASSDDTVNAGGVAFDIMLGNKGTSTPTPSPTKDADDNAQAAPMPELSDEQKKANEAAKNAPVAPPAPESTGIPAQPKSEETTRSIPNTDVVSFDGDGTYLVGVDIQPGTYRAMPANDLGGYWARLSNLTGTDNIIENGTSNGPAIVTILSSDKAFETSMFDTWTLVSD